MLFMFIYVTPRSPLRYTRPLFAARALNSVRVLVVRDLLDWFSLGRVLGLWRKAGRVGWLESGVVIAAALVKLRARNAIILNSIGVREVKGLCSIPVVLDYMDVCFRRGLDLSWYEKLAVEAADGVVFWSRALMKIVCSRYRVKKHCYVPQGVNLQRFNPRRVGGRFFRERYGIGDKFMVCWSGGIWRDRKTGRDYQGSDKLPLLFKFIKRELGDSVVFVVNCPRDPVLFEKFAKIGVDVVWIRPMRFDSVLRQSMYAAADVVVLPGTRFPTVYYAERLKLFEYLASFSGIVAEYTPGVSSVLKDRRNAILVKMDDLENFASAVVELYEDRDFLDELKENSYRDALRYDWSVLSTRYRKFIEDVLEH